MRLVPGKVSFGVVFMPDSSPENKVVCKNTVEALKITVCTGVVRMFDNDVVINNDWS
jgi:hypothetical protein